MITLRQNRINDPKTIDVEYIEKELSEDKHVIVQFSGQTFDDKILSQLDELCEKHDTSLGVRFYGNYSGIFDFKTILKVPHVKCLYADCLTKAVNIDTLKELKYIENLSLGVFELTETEILNSDNLKKLTELILTETKTKALNLEYLKEYKNLNTLIVGGHTKNISAVGNLSNLEFLSLNSIKKVPVDFVNKLRKLKTLKFILGGRENILEIQENQIESLEITWVRGFNDLSNIGNFKNLKNLHIENNIQLGQLQFDTEFNSLVDLKIINCKTFDKLTGLEKLPELNEMVIYQTNLDFETIINQKLSKKLDMFGFYTTKTKIDKEIKKRIIDMGYKTR